MKSKFPQRKTCYEEIQNKKLKEFYLVVQIVTFEMMLGKKPVLELSKIYIIYGIDILGNRTIIGIYVEDKENTRYWLNEIEKIKMRGLKKIAYVSLEKNNRLEQALKIVYNPDIRESINERVERIAKYTQKKFATAGEQEIMRAYVSETAEEYAKAMSEIEDKYKDNAIGILLFKKLREQTDKDIKEPREIRHIINSYITKRKIKERMRKLSREYEEIENIEDLVEKSKEYFSMFERTRIYSKKQWTEILNEIYKIKKEEIQEYI